MTGTADQISPALWAATAAVGSAVTYHRGNLFTDRYDRAVAKTADQWMELCDRGLVNLLQRRIGGPGGGHFEYVAVRTTAPVSESQRVHEAITNGRNIINRLIDTA